MRALQVDTAGRSPEKRPPAPLCTRANAPGRGPARQQPVEHIAHSGKPATHRPNRAEVAKQCPPCSLAAATARHCVSPPAPRRAAPRRAKLLGANFTEAISLSERILPEQPHSSQSYFKLIISFSYQSKFMLKISDFEQVVGFSVVLDAFYSFYLRHERNLARRRRKLIFNERMATSIALGSAGRP